MAKPGLRDTIKKISPPWLQTGNGEKFLYGIGLGMDALLEKLNQAVRMHMPGYGDASGLPTVGTDRLIGQGLTESAAAYALRLKLWLDSWRLAGTPYALLQQVRGYVSALVPMVRTVSDSSAWDTYSPTDNPQTQPPSHFKGSNWNWDNEADPHPTGINAWWRWWLLLFPTTGTPLTITGATNATPIVISTNVPHGLTSGAVHIAGVLGNTAANDKTTADGQTLPWQITVQSTTTFALNGSSGSGAYTSGGTVTPCFTGAEGTWGDGDSWEPIATQTKSWGLSVPYTTIAGLRSLVQLWKSASSWCRWMIVSFDPGLFDPAQPADGVHDPNGTFGSWAKIVSNQYVPARFGNARYCDGTA